MANPSNNFTKSAMKASNSFLFLVFALLFSSCQLSVRLIAGINTKKRFDIEDVEKFYSRSSIPKEQAYIANDSLFALILSQEEFLGDSALDMDVRSHFQPIQILFPDDEADHILFTNCTAKGIRKLDYNHVGAFDQYPPLPYYKQPVLYTLEQYYDNIKPVYSGQETGVDFSRSKPILVLWSLNMKRHSKDMLKYFQAYFASHNLEDRVIYVHNSFLYELFNEAD
jgi:hypothetical protein